MKLREVKITTMVLLSSILFILTVAGCTKTGGGSILDDEIKFTVGSMPNTKTEYDNPLRPFQLIWVKGDQVSIFCEQAGGDSGEPGPGKKEVAYDVTPNTSKPEKGTLNKASTENMKGLRWGDNEPHNLYSVYPSRGTSHGNVAKVSGEEGTFTFEFPKTQYCSKIGVTPTSGNYMLKPEMNLAYMVAKQEGLTPTNNVVNLSFKPIATTLVIKLEGASKGVTEISRFELSVKNIAGDFVKNNGTTYQIQFDAKENFSSDVSNALIAYTTESVSTSDFIVKLTNGEGNFQLKPKESVSFTVFLPPINKLDDVEVRCIDADNTIIGKKRILTSVDFAKSASKSYITLPPLVDTIYFDSDVYRYEHTVEVGETNTINATIEMSDGTTLNTTTGASWTYTIPGIVTPNSTTASSINVHGTKRGATTATISYGGKSASVRIYVAKRYTIDHYYQWDAYAPYDINNYNGTPPWGVGSPTYNPNTIPTASCSGEAGCPTRIEYQRYLGDKDGVYFDNGIVNGEENIQPYLLYNRGAAFGPQTMGIWLKKKNLCSGDLKESVTPKSGRPENISDYFFLPGKTGFFTGGSFLDQDDIPGLYWLATPDGGFNAYELSIKNTIVKCASGVNRYRGYMPLIESNFYVN